MINEKVNPLKQFLPAPIAYTLAVITCIAALLILIPTGYLIVWSLWGTEIVGILRPLAEPTLAWFEKILTDSNWQISISVSVWLALAVALAGTILNILYCYARYFTFSWIPQATSAAMMVLLLNPLIPYSMSLHGLLTEHNTWILLFLGQMVVVLPIQYLIFAAATQPIYGEYLSAGLSCGASHLRNMINVFIPNFKLAIAGSLIVGFFVSLDEVVIALFLLDRSTVSIPVRLWHGLSHTVEPQAAVIAVLAFCITIIGSVIYRKLKKPDPFAIEFLFTKGSQLLLQRILPSIGTGIITLFLVNPQIPKVAALLIKAIVSIMVSYTTLVLIRLYSIRKLIHSLMGVSKIGSGLHQRMATDLVKDGIISRMALASNIYSGGWVGLDADNIQRLTAACFKNVKGRYIGTDRHVPSKFVTFYPDYLETQLSRPNSDGDLRFVLYGEKELQDDYSQNQEVVLEFINAHIVKGIHLLSVPWEDVENILRIVGFQSPDTACFGKKIIVLFRRVESGYKENQVFMLSITTDLEAKLRRFHELLLRKAKSISLLDGHPVFLELEDIQVADIERDIKVYSNQ